MDPAKSKRGHVEFEAARPSLYLIQVYGTKSSALYPEFVKEISDVLRRLKTNECVIFWGDFNAHVGNDTGVWRGMIGQHGDVGVNDNGRLLLQVCCNKAVKILNSSF